MKEVTKPNQFPMLIYGPPGGGKSYFAMCAPGPGLYLDIEGGAYYPMLAAKPENMKVYGQLTASDISAAIQQAVAGKHGELRSIIIDSVTSWVELLLPPAPTLDIWGRVTSTIREDLKRLLRSSIPYVVLIAQQTLDESGRALPAIPPALMRYISAYTMIIAYMEGRTLYVAPAQGRDIVAKDRTGVLPPKITWEEVRNACQL